MDIKAALKGKKKVTKGVMKAHKEGEGVLPKMT